MTVDQQSQRDNRATILSLSDNATDANTTAELPRVLLIAASLRFMGGQAVMAQRLVEDLRKDGTRIRFLPVDPQLPSLLRPFDRVKYVRTVTRTFFYVLSLIRELPKCDVVHVFSASYSSFLISPAPAILLAQLFRRPTILNYHSGEAEDHLRRSGWLTKWLLGLPDIIVVGTQYLVTVFGEFGFHAIAIPNHIDLSNFRFRERSRLRPSIVVCRALERLYNIPCALKAFRLLQEKYPQAELTILGNGSQGESLQRFAVGLGLSNVSFTGRVERPDIAKFLDKADIFLNTSSIDNLPVSILEAFAAGLPIVTTNPGGIPDVISDRANGHLVNVDDHEAVARRLIELLTNPGEARRLSLAGREELRKYTWDVVGANWKTLYRELLSRQSKRSEPSPCQTTA